MARGDHARLWNFFQSVEILAADWHVRGDERSARRAGEWLRAWIVTPATRMNPHLEYAQVQLGHNNNHGSNYGVIDARGFGQVIDALRLLHDSPALKPGEESAIKEWFAEYLHWLTTAENAVTEHAMKSNHGSWYLAQAIPIARYVGRDDLALTLCEEAKSLIAEQINADGSIPREIRRVNGLGYSVFNLKAHARTARLAAGLGIDLWNHTAPNGASLRRAVDFLRPYNQAPETWPYSQNARLDPGFLDELVKEMESATSKSSKKITREFAEKQIRRQASPDARMPPNENTHSALWGKNGEAWSPASRLPDFSFAGYARGERSIPDSPVTHNIRDFGAKGDGVTDDSAAFQRAVAAVDPGVILIPAGRYLITDIIDINKSNLVLRGEDPARTILYFPKPLNDIRPDWSKTTTGMRTSNYSWAGGFIWVKGSLGLQKLADITRPAARGATTLTLASTDGLSAGDTIAVCQRDLPDNSLAIHLYSDEPADVANLKGSTKISLPARIVRIDGLTITIDRPLRTDLRLEWKPAVHCHAPTVSEVGVENLTFEFPVTPYGGHFTELGFNAMAFSDVAHCWIRNIRIRNSDSGLMIKGDFCTIDGVVMDSLRAPDKVRGGQGHHGIYLSGNDNLFTHFNIRLQFEHDITMGACSSGNVVSEGWGEDLCLDHHRRAPYENLFTNIDAGAGTHLWRCGGGRALGWHCGARGTFWNIRARQPLAYPPPKFGPWSINVVGLTTKEPSSITTNGLWFETLAPETLLPPNLHLAQRLRRLKESAPVPAE
ncbi:hypothetical protein AW736_10440 [Termitidicoccus mucosus]|uniref:Pectate lyase superfamily protein domain-containing protein n=1 Tax=Termitidicoccus mucosus TaxID=1184151 RepID=A0A178IKG7_9BACT|nr:hypothetical protein AW736_10440 [Opitutaceae bacterium TSB47]